MAGRDLFEMTRGASLMLNPDMDAIALYSPEIAAILRGKELGYFTKSEISANEELQVGPPSVSTVKLNAVLLNLFGEETTVKTARTEQVDHSNRSTVITAPDPDHGATTGRNRPEADTYYPRKSRRERNIQAHLASGK